MNKKKVFYKLKAFSLAEVLIVLAIIGILILLALPNLLPLISKAKSTEAQLQLEHIYTLEKSYFYIHSSYSTNLDEIGFEHSKLVSQGGQANYRIEITNADMRSFKAKATAIADFDGDGTYNEWEVDQEKALKETVKD
ncbi:MAG TPA: prepilin-type N-terminal cleavage/methylation domain-containing protein [Saprospiraceae bacterium]|nr:prepilin-type N-terminal cleavage/methylation domain-containing protein [Saprospiraceae bacterium]